MELDEVVRKRRMTRTFSDEPVAAAVLDRVLGVASRGPSAGFSQGVDLVVLEGPVQTRWFFELTSDEEFLLEPGTLHGVLRAPVIVLPVCDPSAYVARYAEKDKARSSLAGMPAERWAVPYWLVDASFSVMLLLLAATNEGLGALFFRLHRDPGPLLRALGAPGTSQVIGAVALGYEAAPDSPAASAKSGSSACRTRRPLGDVVHRGRW